MAMQRNGGPPPGGSYDQDSMILDSRNDPYGRNRPPSYNAPVGGVPVNQYQ